MKIVVTGATGLVGRKLISLIQDGHEVWAVSRGPAPGVSHPRVHWVTADLAAPQLPADLPTSADAVVHLAQSPHYRDFPNEALDIFGVNVGSTVRLLDWSRAAGVRHFVFASSGAVGSAGTARSYYVASKHSGEMFTASYADCFRVLTVRFFFVYGHGQKASMLVPRLINAVRTGEPVSLLGHDGARLNPVHVDDAARALARALDLQATGLINIAGPEVVTIRDMSETIATRVGRPAAFTVDSSQTAPDLVGDISRMSGLLGAPRLSFKDGLDEMV